MPPLNRNAGDSGTQTEANLLDASSDRFSAQSADDSVALALVNSTYERYRIWRYRNHDLRWNTDDALYVGWMPQRFWEGSRTPRSSLGHQMTFDQVEAALPVIHNALFGEVDWFECDPLLGATQDQARQKKERLMYLLENPHNKTGNTARNEFLLAEKQLLTYGNGFVGIDHDGETGDPVIAWKDCRDIYLSPGCATPFIDDSQSLIDRTFLTWDELEALRGQPGISLPPKEALRAMTLQRPADTADFTKQNQEAYRNIIWRPGYDDSTDFAPYRGVEVRRYWDKNRVVWVLNTRWVMYNQKNPYRLLPYAAAPCYIMPGRFYGMGIADVLEGLQKYSQAILNGRLDELSLQLNPPRATNRSATMTANDQLIRPGMTWRYEHPKDDMILFPPSGATNNGWQEIQFMAQEAQQRTGVTSMITNGTPMRANASRTATGINAQAAGPTSRLQQIVQQIEDYMVVPLLYKLIAVDAYHAKSGNSSLIGMGPDGKYTDVSADALSAPTKFRIKGSSRMLTQAKLQQAIPFVMQYFMNGAFVSQLAKTGQTVDYNEVNRMIQDAVGTRTAYNLVRPMSAQEQQALSQPSPDAQARLQAQQQANDVRIKIAEIKKQASDDAAAATATKGNEELSLKLLELFSTAEGQAALSGDPTAAPALQMLQAALSGGGSPGGGPDPGPADG